MLSSRDRIVTTHAGRIINPPDFQELEAALRSGQPLDQARYDEARRKAVTESVRRQAEIGVDVISDGEHGKRLDYAYYSQRIAGIESRDLKPGEVAVTVAHSREREEFAEFFADYMRTQPAISPFRAGTRMVAAQPLVHKDLGPLQRELDTLKSAMQGLGVAEAFFPILAPGWLDHFIFNEAYPTEDAYIYGLADALKPEYKAVIDAGILLQLDDPGLPDSWPTFFPEPDVAEYRKFAQLRIEALNYALQGLPEDRIRYHICWGSWNGPHTQDLPFEHVVDIMLSVNAQCFSFEFANARHAHEYHIWEDVKLPEGKLLMPGVIDHTTNVVEHPEVVAERIVTFANLVGRENVIAGTDCGMRGHPQIAWAKLKSLVDGAAVASKKLWGRG